MEATDRTMDRFHATTADGTPPFEAWDAPEHGSSPPQSSSSAGGFSPMDVFFGAADFHNAAAAASTDDDDDDEEEKEAASETAPPIKRHRQEAAAKSEEEEEEEEKAKKDRAVNAAVEGFLRDVRRRRMRDHPGRSSSEGPAKGDLFRWLGAVHARLGGAGEALHLVDLRQVTIDGEANQRRRGFLAGAGVRRWLAEHCRGSGNGSGSGNGRQIRIPEAGQVVVAVAAHRKTTARLVADGEDGCKKLAVLRHCTVQGKDAWSHVCTITIDNAPFD